MRGIMDDESPAVEVHQALAKADQFIQSQFLGLHGESPLKSSHETSIIIAVPQANARREPPGASQNERWAHQYDMPPDEIAPLLLQIPAVFRGNPRDGNGTAVAIKDG